MRLNLISLLVVISTLNAFSQDTLKVTKLKVSAEKPPVSRIILSTSTNGIYEFIDKQDDGAILSKGYASSYDPFIKAGKETIFYKNGKIKSIHYNGPKNNAVGEYFSFYENGLPKLVGEFLQPSPLRSLESFEYPKFIVKQISDSVGTNFLDSEATGFVKITYQNGNKITGQYIKGKKQGEWNELVAKTNESYIEDFKDGILVKGLYTDSIGKTNKYTKIAVYPEYKYGITELYSFIKKNLKYPAMAKTQNIQGSILLNFIVQKDGALTDFKILKSVPNGEELEDESIRVLKITSKWTPGVQRGKPVKVTYSIPITFSLGQRN